MISRNIDKAREAYKNNDVERCKLAHANNGHSNEKINVNSNENININIEHEKHKKGGEFLKSLVYGGLDGIITTFAIVMSGLGANMQMNTMLVMGVSNMFGDGVSMAMGDYLSSRAEQDYIKGERLRETWEVENNPQGELLEMEELYIKKGMTPEDAATMSKLISKNKKCWIDIMMVEELGLIETDESPIKNAIVTFISFVCFGVIPILPFIVNTFYQSSQQGLFVASIALTALSLCVLGLVKVLFTQRNLLLSVVETLLVGGFSAAVSFLIGFLLKHLIQEAKC